MIGREFFFLHYPNKKSMCAAEVIEALDAFGLHIRHRTNGSYTNMKIPLPVREKLKIISNRVRDMQHHQGDYQDETLRVVQDMLGVMHEMAAKLGEPALCDAAEVDGVKSRSGPLGKADGL